MSRVAPFTGLSVEAARRSLANHLKDKGIESPELDARLLIGAALGLDHTGLAIQATRKITDGEAAIVEGHAARRIAHEPVARILNRKEFWGLDLQLSEATLVPRPDTETVVEAALAALRSGPHGTSSIRIADIGAGSGAILLALLSELPEAIGVGTDISMAALETARENARRLGLAERASFVQDNYAAGLVGSFHIIVSNPPYIRSADIAKLDPDVRDHDPHLALDGGPDGFKAYRAIIPQAAALLCDGGTIVIEVGYDQSAAVSDIMRAAGLTLVGTPKADLQGIHRVVIGQKTAG